MRTLKKTGVFLLALTMIFSLFTVGCAALEDTGFSDVAADAWYADAVAYCAENNLMSGTGDAVFAPDAAMSRAMLTTVLHRMQGSPVPEQPAAFADVPADAWYSDAVAWATQSGILTGYGSGLFAAKML